jgi:ribosomal protein S18 acetylase RimI-like enzyme
MSAPEIALLDPARVDDLEPLWRALHAHHREVSALPVLADDDLSWRRRRAWYERLLAGGEGFGVVARRGDAPIGYALVEVRDGADDTWPYGRRMAEVVTLSVVPDSRGGGIGTALMDAVDAELERRGVHSLEIAVMAGNDRARAFYERRGLRVGELLLFRFGDRA